MDWEKLQERKETGRARIAERPIVSWAGHTIVFALVAVLLQAVRGDGIDWARAATMAALVAAALVVGSVIGSRVRRR